MIDFQDDEKKLKGYTFIDLFCGIGGFHLALSSLGAKCVFACDIDTEAKKVYEKNFNIVPKGDITKIKADDIPAHNILCAGFPCQPFSISGNQQGFEDELGRGKLFFDIIRIARYHKPQVIILENVRNLENHNNGSTFKQMKDELKKIDYNVFCDVLCASDYSIPQKRKRIYIVAFHKDLNIQDYKFPQPQESFKVLGDVLIKKTDNDVRGKYYIDRQYTITKKYKKRENNLLRIGQIGLGRQGERIYSIKGQAITLSSHGGGIGGKTGMYLIRNKVRKLYPRECARLMGFPDTFKLADTQEKNYKQFGNSVVVDLIQLIVKEVSAYLPKTGNENSDT